MGKALAIDIGASSGRHIIGWWENGELRQKEVYRFENGVTEKNGHLLWDIDRLLSEVKKGIDAAISEDAGIETLGIDTWGVDYVLMKGEETLYPVYAYRDHRTEKIIDKVHQMIPFAALYRETGIQFQPFNTVYQLTDDLLSGRLHDATDFLMIPEYLIYGLTGRKVHEYTNATTTGLLNAETGEFSKMILSSLSLPERLFPKLHRAGETVGEYKGIKVVLTMTHDTASAVEGIPMEGKQIYISSGTWSLLGVKAEKPLTDEKSRAANFTNEGGKGYIRYQKNIMGMWLVNELRRELCPETPIGEIVKMAERSGFNGTVDTEDPVFLSPKSMRAAFDGKLTEKPETPGDYFRSAYCSLADSYARSVKEIEENFGTEYKKIYIVGGGAGNGFLNRLTEERTGKKIVALPIEATARGNLLIQLCAEKKERDH